MQGVLYPKKNTWCENGENNLKNIGIEAKQRQSEIVLSNRKDKTMQCETERF